MNSRWAKSLSVAVAIFSAAGLALSATAKPTLNSPSGVFTQLETEEVEAQVASAFANRNCGAVKALAQPQVLLQVRASVLAVFAYCELPNMDSEELFERAERLEPGSDTIALLHARYRWKKDPAASMELWNRVLVLARNPTIKSMAQDYVLGISTGEEEVSTVENGHSYFVRMRSGLGFEANPAQSAIASGTPAGSQLIDLTGELNYQRTYGFGYLGANTSTTNSFFKSEAGSNTSTHELAFPLGIFTGNDTDLVLQPFGSFSTYGPTPFQLTYGASVVGLAYRANYRQSVKGSLFFDHFYDDSLQPQQGLHYRFEYNWEFFVPRWFYRFGISAEHVKANLDYPEDDNGASGAKALISYSHTDFALIGVLERSFRNFSVGLSPQFLVREDSDSSTYIQAGSTTPFTSRRQDLQATIRATVTLTHTAQLQTLVWYEWARNFSSFGPRDFLDYNIQNQTVALAIQGTLRSF